MSVLIARANHAIREVEELNRLAILQFDDYLHIGIDHQRRHWSLLSLFVSGVYKAYRLPKYCI
ncbi:hypothetical protein D3C71_2000710 [compost metagenome]